MKQPHERNVFDPIDINLLTESEKGKAMESLIFLVEKSDKRIKVQTCANGSIQREFISKEEASNPTATIESILLTGIIEAKDKRDVMTIDIPNAFSQMLTNKTKDDDQIIMKIRGPLDNMLVNLDLRFN